MARQSNAKGFSTRAIHGGRENKTLTRDMVKPMHLSVNFRMDHFESDNGFEYSRHANPSRNHLEEQLAILENSRWALSFSSGMAAASAVLRLLKQGDHVLLSKFVYPGTLEFFRNVLSNAGISFDLVDARDSATLGTSFKTNTKLLWLESPSNPHLHITDIRKASCIAKSKQSLSIVDNTFASPCLQNPLVLGADIVLHSATKYLGGHSDLLAGALMGDEENLLRRLKDIQYHTGALPGALECHLLSRGIKTLALRMKAHCENAGRIARYLSEHPKVKKVYYPGLPKDPNHEIAKSQMKDFGGMLSFELHGGEATAKKLVEHTALFLPAQSLGSPESLICHPASMMYNSFRPEEQQALEISNSLLRLSVGLENIEDLLEDLHVALEKV